MALMTILKRFDPSSIRSLSCRVWYTVNAVCLASSSSQPHFEIPAALAFFFYLISEMGKPMRQKLNASAFDMKEKHTKESHKKSVVCLLVLCSYEILGNGNRVSEYLRVLPVQTPCDMSTAALLFYCCCLVLVEHTFLWSDLNEHVLNNTHTYTHRTGITIKTI